MNGVFRQNYRGLLLMMFSALLALSLGACLKISAHTEHGSAPLNTQAGPLSAPTPLPTPTPTPTPKIEFITQNALVLVTDGSDSNVTTQRFTREFDLEVTDETQTRFASTDRVPVHSHLDAKNGGVQIIVPFTITSKLPENAKLGCSAQVFADDFETSDDSKVSDCALAMNGSSGTASFTIHPHAVCGESLGCLNAYISSLVSIRLNAGDQRFGEIEIHFGPTEVIADINYDPLDNVAAEQADGRYPELSRYAEGMLSPFIEFHDALPMTQTIEISFAPPVFDCRLFATDRAPEFTARVTYQDAQRKDVSLRLVANQLDCNDEDGEIHLWFKAPAEAVQGAGDIEQIILTHEEPSRDPEIILTAVSPLL